MLVLPMLVTVTSPDKAELNPQSKRILGTRGIPLQSHAAWLLIVIDTDSVKTLFPDPSRDQESPTSIAPDVGFLVATGIKVEPGQRTGELRIAALMGDTVCVSATSGSDNFEDAVLLYGMTRSSGDQVFSDFGYQNVQELTVVPISTLKTPSLQIATETFGFHQANVTAAGTEGYEVPFALHIRDADTGQPVLYGYFSWNLEITVEG
ncbi:MAG: AidA/PixA family protein [Terracidiphilus sp.]